MTETRKPEAEGREQSESRRHEPAPQSPPLVLALFQKRIEGDDALLRLAQLRFRQAGLGTEFYAGHPDELERLLDFRPAAETPAVVHLPRNIDLLNAGSRDLILAFGRRFSGRLHGCVIHDQPEIVDRFEDYLGAARELDSQLKRAADSPLLFIEYAAGLEPGRFAEMHSRLRDLETISACIDVGHVGIWQARKTYEQMHPGEDVCALKRNPRRLPEVIQAVKIAVSSALPAVLPLIQTLGGFGKPLHFHLHDGHPLSTASPHGVSDHLSFLAEIPIGFEHQGRTSLPPMFGPAGLSQIVTAARQSPAWSRSSFTLEIHETDGRLPLGEAGSIFGHWRDSTNAEKMNHWLSVLVQNHQLLRSRWNPK